MKFSVTIPTLVISVSVLLGLTGCDKQVDATVNDEQTAKPVIQTSESTQKAVETVPADAPTYQVLVDTSYPPYTFRNEQGEIVGFEVDMLKAIAEKEQFHLQLISSTGVDLFHKLEKEENHIIASALELSPELRQSIKGKAVMTDSFIETQPVAAFISEDIKNINDVKANNIGVTRHGSYIPSLKKDMEGSAGNVIEYKTSFVSFQSMITGKVDSSVSDVHVIAHYIEQFKDSKLEKPIKIVPIASQDKHSIAFAVSEDQPELLAKINSGLKKLDADGTYDMISAKWLQ